MDTPYVTPIYEVLAFYFECLIEDRPFWDQIWLHLYYLISVKVRFFQSSIIIWFWSKAVSEWVIKFNGLSWDITFTLESLSSLT